jgi:hypothetical protein
VSPEREIRTQPVAKHGIKERMSENLDVVWIDDKVGPRAQLLGAARSR